MLLKPIFRSNSFTLASAKRSFSCQSFRFSSSKIFFSLNNLNLSFAECMSSFKQQHTLNSFPQSQRTEQNQHFSFQKRNFSSSIEWLTSSKTTNWGAVFLILGVGGVIVNELWKKRALAAEVKKERKGSDATNSELDRNVQLKEFSREEVSKHKTKETGIWVTFGNEVCKFFLDLERNVNQVKTTLLLDD